MRDVRPGDHGCLLAFPAMLLRSYGCRLRAARVVDYLFFRAAPTPGASAPAEFLARLEAEPGDPGAAFDHSTPPTPAPVSVTSRLSASSFSTSAICAPRPTKLVSCTGRL